MPTLEEARNKYPPGTIFVPAHLSYPNNDKTTNLIITGESIFEFDSSIESLNKRIAKISAE